jgi:hypothetical protein
MIKKNGSSGEETSSEIGKRGEKNDISIEQFFVILAILCLTLVVFFLYSWKWGQPAPPLILNFLTRGQIHKPTELFDPIKGLAVGFVKVYPLPRP